MDIRGVYGQELQNRIDETNPDEVHWDLQDHSITPLAVKVGTREGGGMNKACSIVLGNIDSSCR